MKTLCIQFGRRSAARLAAAVLMASGMALPSQSHAVPINGGFEDPDITGGYSQLAQSLVPGWSTTDSQGLIEIWNSGFNGVPAFEGGQFAEINATGSATMFQDVSSIASGLEIAYEFAHRGRAGVDVVRFTITDLGADNTFDGGMGDDTTLFSDLFSAGTGDWVLNAGVVPILSLGNDVRFAWTSESTASSSASVGNFLDAATFSVGTLSSVPLPPSAWLLLGGLALLGATRARSTTSRAPTA